MELTNIPGVLIRLAPELDRAIKNELLRANLSRTGDLLNSVTTVPVMVSEGVEIRTYMLDYWKYLDAKHDFISKAVQPMIADITERLMKAGTQDIIDHLQKTMKR